MSEKILFAKMHGAGNDFVVMDALKEPFGLNKDQIQKLCDRNFGIGADQLLVIAPSEVADIKMLIFNADGDEVEMCGNGIRCIADFAYRYFIVKSKEMTVETLGGIMKPVITGNGIRVDMGEPILEGKKIPTGFDGQVVNQPLEVEYEKFDVTAVSMGNPHCVIFEKNGSVTDLHKWGPLIENHEKFPNRTNVEFIQVQSPEKIKCLVWERGSGQTLACGTGACASVVAGVLTGNTGRNVEVELLGGTLQIEWDEASNHVFMTGPSVEVFRGEVEI